MEFITDQDLRHYREHGYLLTSVSFTPAELQEFSEATDRLQEVNVQEARDSGDPKMLELALHRPFIGQAHQKSAVVAEFVKKPVYLEACAKLLGPDADLYFNQIVTKPPETGKHFAWHQDSGYVLVEPLEYITCWTAIGPTFVENGCIWVIPGSHRRGLQEHLFNEEFREYRVEVEESAAVPVPMKAGQVAVFSSLLLHRSGPNTSTCIRRGFVPQYHVPGAIWPHTGGPAGDAWPVLRAGNRV